MIATGHGRRLRRLHDIPAFGAVALIPGVSRSGATISAGLLRDLDRVAATRLAFLLAIPALVAAGAYQAIREASVISTGVGWLPTVLATGVSFVVGYASIAWLLRFVAKHRITVFIWYRVALAAVIAVLLGTGMLMRFSTLRRISSLIGRTASTPLPAGSSSTQSS